LLSVARAPTSSINLLVAAIAVSVLRIFASATATWASATDPCAGLQNETVADDLQKALETFYG